MNLLADENIPLELVKILRSEGHLVDTIADTGMLGTSDLEILRYAVSHKLTILTEDKDFGYLTEFSPLTSPRVVLLRFDFVDIDTISQQLLSALKQIEAIIPTGRMMAVLSNGKLRIREWKG